METLDGLLIEEATILIVDDTPQNIDILVEALGDDYNLQVATNGEDALESVADETPDLILLDIMMPGMDGFEVCRRLKAEASSRDVPVIFLTAMTDVDQKTKGFSIGAIDYITKPFNIQEVMARVETHLSVKLARDVLKQQKDRLEEMVIERTEEIAMTRDVTIRMAASLAETRDNETGNHIIRTQQYVKALATHLAGNPEYARELTPLKIDQLVKSAPLHDIGKVGVPDRILQKQGKLEEDEYEEMKRHTIYGAEALQRAEAYMDDTMRRESFLEVAREIAVSHHERWDGKGYPKGLQGKEIPLYGRIMAIADVYDALISSRVYKPAFTHKRACEIIAGGRGTQFDPDITDQFLEIAERILQIARELMESEEDRRALVADTAYEVTIGGNV